MVRPLRFNFIYNGAKRHPPSTFDVKRSMFIFFLLVILNFGHWNLFAVCDLDFWNFNKSMKFSKANPLWG